MPSMNTMIAIFCLVVVLSGTIVAAAHMKHSPWVALITAGYALEALLLLSAWVMSWVASLSPALLFAVHVLLRLGRWPGLLAVAAIMAGLIGVSFVLRTRSARLWFGVGAAGLTFQLFLAVSNAVAIAAGWDFGNMGLLGVALRWGSVLGQLMVLVGVVGTLSLLRSSSSSHRSVPTHLFSESRESHQTP
jgi:hypothetical protein